MGWLGKAFSLVTGFSENYRKEVDPQDGKETSSEWMIPGDEFVQKVQWVVERLAIGSCVTSMGFGVKYAAIFSIPLGIATAAFFIGLIVIHLNTLVRAFSWSIFSGLLIITGLLLSAYLLIVTHL